MGQWDDLDHGLSLADASHRCRAITSEDRETVRRLTRRHAESASDETTLLAMLGLDISDTPPDFPCVAGCGRRSNRVLCNNERGICMSCRRKERIAAGELLPPKPREKSAKRRPYKRRVGTKL
ncbi:hypothetical protein [Nocardia gipuzkoensis]|uniref:hypothetical protein n=1 Tax=Nocardia gipuzkoensis TaxID=2749991 RepID=UPI00237E38AB|nr:hypothetical protein [Nocardia gipuzkoensis]MDE1673834.1 hypothetical protein [Nocardia gipuzkoensis]